MRPSWKMRSGRQPEKQMSRSILKKGCVVPHSPPFQRRGARGIKSLEAEGGVVSKRSRSLLIDVREAHLILLEITNHYQCFALSGSRFAPVCAAEEQDRLLMAQPPLLKNGGEWASSRLS